MQAKTRVAGGWPVLVCAAAICGFVAIAGQRAGGAETVGPAAKAADFKRTGWNAMVGQRFMHPPVLTYTRVEAPPTIAAWYAGTTPNAARKPHAWNRRRRSSTWRGCGNACQRPAHFTSPPEPTIPAPGVLGAGGPFRSPRKPSIAAARCWRRRTRLACGLLLSRAPIVRPSAATRSQAPRPRHGW